MKPPLTHRLLWFVGLWVLMRFQWGHALGLAFVMWLTVTLVILPMLLDTAGTVAMEKRSPLGSPKAWITCLPGCA